MTPAIRVHNLGKRYRISHEGDAHGKYRTLRDSVMDLARAPLRRLKNRGEEGQQEDFWALKDVSFDVQPGEVVGIIGRNGAGKSTLLKILSRITKPSTGSVELNGRVGSLLEVGTGFHPELTGRENIFLNGSILGMKRAEIQKQFDAIVDFSGIEQFLDTPVKRYSSGMSVRLAFAVAAHLQPEILVIDEVLAVGDAEFQAKCLGKMQDVAKCGRTVLFVSHSMPAVRALCSRGLLLQRGGVEFDGSTDEVAGQYLNNCLTRNTSNRFVRPGQTGITFLKLIDQSGLEHSTLEPQMAIWIEAQFAVKPGLIVKSGLKIYDSMGLPLFETRSAITNDNCNFRLSVPIHMFRPGKYKIGGAVWDDDKIYYEEHDLFEFIILPTHLNTFNGRHSSAYFVLKGTWATLDASDTQTRREL
jgi:lipopolysaccharide transport system ATP-binding protein